MPGFNESRIQGIPPFMDDEPKDTRRLAGTGKGKIQVNVPELLKQRLTVVLTIRGETLTEWMEQQITLWLREHEAEARATFLANTEEV